MNPYEGLDPKETKRAIILENVCFGCEDISPISTSYSESESED